MVVAPTLVLAALLVTPFNAASATLVPIYSFFGSVVPGNVTDAK